MENSLDEKKAQQSFRSPPRRRRSTFFERRDSILPQSTTENVHGNFCQNTDKNEKHDQDLIRYYDKLLLEKELWKKEVNNRRNKYHDLRQQYQMEIKASSRSRISYAALSNEDIEFLKGKPNMLKLFESQQKLHKSVKESRALYRRVNELDDAILNYCEDKINKVTEYILENSTVEAIN